MSRTTPSGSEPVDTPSRSTPDDDRLRGGARRVPGEPLAASWRPERPPRRTTAPRGVRGVLAAYGWRVYALPVLLAVTALVAVQTAGEKGGAVAATPTGEPLAADGAPIVTGPPEVTERAGTPVDVSVPTADLPNGGPYSQSGAGTWHGVPGHGERVGAGPKLYTYTVEVEDGIDPTAFSGDAAFAQLIDQTLADPRGWTSLGEISVQRVEPDFPDPSFRVSLTSPDTAHRPDMCGYSIKYESSCYRGTEKRVMINLARWVRGAVVFGGDMLTYRQYAINHEIGHAFRNSHVGCAQNGALAPVMMQQSFGVANNYVAQLNRAVGLTDAVKTDGLVCKPNAWPNPQAQPAG
ncbi:DUF3152 domain-containing protein [Actinokineospora spheciospongiae]|uniref:DUF3152 domain-containing protein n=1 Tax=Actinokineospora spheciospongiae TaxID=909613 RepID=UPI000D7100B8|nr:DUF3152 domain-containing protein [Actinokineospora spheciospongiae]